ncbi:MAG: disulfide oxidoreductase [Epulopiscium sp. Nele67-Bin004]|nr:MAG: disulfide oxidoreductase [Epulopiscium sp. Nele67-Bin004]
MQITKDMIIGQIIQIDRGLIPILMNSGMHCVGCPSSQSESLEDACAVHGTDVDTLVNELNTYLQNK